MNISKYWKFKEKYEEIERSVLYNIIEIEGVKEKMNCFQKKDIRQQNSVKGCKKSKNTVPKNVKETFSVMKPK